MVTHPQPVLIGTARIAPEAEGPWNRWYDEVHLPEILSCPGFLSAARYVSGEGAEREYVALYRLESEAALESVEFAERRGWYQFASDVTATVRHFEKISEGVPSRE